MVSIIHNIITFFQHGEWKIAVECQPTQWHVYRLSISELIIWPFWTWSFHNVSAWSSTIYTLIKAKTNVVSGDNWWPSSKVRYDIPRPQGWQRIPILLRTKFLPINIYIMFILRRINFFYLQIITRRSENDNTPQPLDQWMNSPFMGQRVGNCRSFTLTHYLAGLGATNLSWDKNWDSHSLVNGYPSFYPRIALVAPSPDLFAMHCDPRASPLWIWHCIQLASLLFQFDQPSHS